MRDCHKTFTVVYETHTFEVTLYKLEQADCPSADNTWRMPSTGVAGSWTHPRLFFLELSRMRKAWGFDTNSGLLLDLASKRQAACHERTQFEKLSCPQRAYTETCGTIQCLPKQLRHSVWLVHGTGKAVFTAMRCSYTVSSAGVLEQSTSESRRAVLW